MNERLSLSNRGANCVAKGVACTFSIAPRLTLLCIVALVYSHPTAGQVFQLTGGSSSLMNAEGGSVEVHGASYTGRIDLGYLDGPSLGFFFSRPYKDSQLGAGDQQIPFLLPTDLFDRSFYFLGRGMSLTRNVNGRLFVFAGTTSDGYSAPFLNIAHADTPAGAIFYERQLSPSVRFFSRNMISDRQTSIQALEWAARKDIKMALSAGVGNNQPYGATSFTMNRRWMTLDASYARSGDAFRRVLVSTPQLAENDRENIRLELKPFSNVRIVINRNNYLATFSPNVVQRAMVQGVRFLFPVLDAVREFLRAGAWCAAILNAALRGWNGFPSQRLFKRRAGPLHGRHVARNFEFAIQPHSSHHA